MVHKEKEEINRPDRESRIVKVSICNIGNYFKVFLFSLNREDNKNLKLENVLMEASGVFSARRSSLSIRMESIA